MVVFSIVGTGVEFVKMAAGLGKNISVTKKQKNLKPSQLYDHQIKEGSKSGNLVIAEGTVNLCVDIHV